MRILILSCILGIAAASFMQEAAPAVDESIIAFLKGSMEPGSLEQALGVSDPLLTEIEDDLKTSLGKFLKEGLENFLSGIQGSIDRSKLAASNLSEKGKQLKEVLERLLKEGKGDTSESHELIRETGAKVLKGLRKQIGHGERNLDDQMDEVARLKFLDLIENIKQKILAKETIDKIREYFKRISSEGPLGRKLKEIVEKLRDIDIEELMRCLLEHRSSVHTPLKSETWDKIKKFFKDLNVEIQNQSKKFGEWVKSVWSKGLTELKQKYGAIKAIAMEFIANSKDVSAEIAKEALEFFRPYKEDLGTLWKKIGDATKESIGKF